MRAGARIARTVAVALVLALVWMLPAQSQAQTGQAQTATEQKPPASGEKIVAGLSQNRVSITANFDGSEILIYGAVKREAPEPKSPRLEIIIAVEGPSVPQIIRRKEKVAGIWINRGAITVDSAPTFYAVATTGPLAEVLSNTEDLRYKISVKQVVRAIGASSESKDAADYVAAFERIRRTEGEYRVSEGSVQLLEGTLFRADVVLPSNLTEGRYRVRIFLTRGGKVVDNHERIIAVRKAGLERDLYNYAHEQPLAYGIACLVLAVVAGWGASAAFRFIRS